MLTIILLIRSIMSNLAFVIFILVCHYFSCGDTANILVENVGLMEFYKDDVAMIFFVQVRDQSPEASEYIADIESIECCEFISIDEKDCESMKLMGGNVNMMPSGESINMTLLYPTTYGYNRHGTCLVRISYQVSQLKQLSQEIVFNTIIKDNTIPKGLGDFYNPANIKPCQSLDEDPFNFCAPVDCIAKYSGMRNIFNIATNRCEKAETCTGEEIYDPVNNKCRRLSPITQEDRKEFDKLSTKRQKENLFQGVCHKGKIEMGACICDEGWKTERSGDSTVQSLYFCNVPYSENIFTTQSLKTLNINEIVFSLIITLLIILLIIFVDRKYERRSGRPHPANYPSISYYRVISTDN